jgi:hypothetical protein
MSLDVYLELEGASFDNSGQHIFIREDGAQKEITLEEWRERFPDRDHFVTETSGKSSIVYDANITHNLNRMAAEAGIYDHLWRPDENGITKASQLVVPLEFGLSVLKSDRVRFEKFNPSNGWGTYDGLVSFVENYLNACKQYPQANVSVSR